LSVCDVWNIPSKRVEVRTSALGRVIIKMGISTLTFIYILYVAKGISPKLTCPRREIVPTKEHTQHYVLQVQLCWCQKWKKPDISREYFTPSAGTFLISRFIIVCQWVELISVGLLCWKQRAGMEESGNILY